LTGLRAGDEVRRIITVTADGVLAGQIPEPQVPASRAIRQTLIQTDRSETIVNESVQSVATFTYRVKAESPIPVFLDTIRMGWWNTTDNTAAEAIVPARRINVGLPDRADVLSELARVETGTGKLQHWIQSNGTARSLIVTSGALAFLILCWQGVTPTRRTIQHYRERSVRRQQLTPLKDLNDPAALYRYLQRPCNRHILETEDCRLLQEIEQGLFSDKGEPLSSAQYREWITRADVALSKTRSLQSSAAHSPLGLL